MINLTSNLATPCKWKTITFYGPSFDGNLAPKAGASEERCIRRDKSFQRREIGEREREMEKDGERGREKVCVRERESAQVFVFSCTITAHKLTQLCWRIHERQKASGSSKKRVTKNNKLRHKIVKVVCGGDCVLYFRNNYFRIYIIYLFYFILFNSKKIMYFNWSERRLYIYDL